jgi:hypothetical protein
LRNVKLSQSKKNILYLIYYQTLTFFIVFTVFLNRKKMLPEVPVFLNYLSFTADKLVNLTRQLSSKSSAGQDSSNGGPVRNNVSHSRRRSRDQSSLPYGFTGHQKMDTNVNDVEVVSHLQGFVPKFSQFK